MPNNVQTYWIDDRTGQYSINTSRNDAVELSVKYHDATDHEDEASYTDLEKEAFPPMKLESRKLLPRTATKKKALTKHGDIADGDTPMCMCMFMITFIRGGLVLVGLRNGTLLAMYIARARLPSFSRESTSALMHAINGRSYLKPLLTTDYIGNVVMHGPAELTFGEIVAPGAFPLLAALMRASNVEVDDALYRAAVEWVAGVLISDASGFATMGSWTSTWPARAGKVSRRIRRGILDSGPRRL
ncbi:hypothetical protein DL767_010729 [Monosporascus sp. MG133]|nr:hypothetical protein DL767_010729 [Monosporascus sp. MG133]